jgi:hypothetical protein
MDFWPESWKLSCNDPKTAPYNPFSRNLASDPGKFASDPGKFPFYKILFTGFAVLIGYLPI